MFKTICVDHVGIACKDLDLSKKFYTEVLGLSCTGDENSGWYRWCRQTCPPPSTRRKVSPR